MIQERKIGIVGSEGKYWTAIQRRTVVQQIQKILIGAIDKSRQYQYLGAYGYPILISGGCGVNVETNKIEKSPGVDGWAEIVCDCLNFKKDIQYPKTNSWAGYKERNEKIGELSDIVYCFEPEFEPFSGKQFEIRDGEFCRRSGGFYPLVEAIKRGKSGVLTTIYKNGSYTTLKGSDLRLALESGGML